MTVRKFFGNMLMVIGVALVLGALALFAYNLDEAEQAQKSVERLLPQLVEKIEEQQHAQTTQSTISGGEPLGNSNIPELPLDTTSVKMAEVEIDGYAYIGYLSIPSLELELPIMADWDYTRLKIAPCRYSGTVGGDDLVLMAHNYRRHFGQLSKLSTGDLVIFTDMDGTDTRYEVTALDILTPTAVDEMTAGTFDLTLFTCTYGGRSRVTVYCDRA